MSRAGAPTADLKAALQGFLASNLGDRAAKADPFSSVTVPDGARDTPGSQAAAPHYSSQVRPPAQRDRRTLLPDDLRTAIHLAESLLTAIDAVRPSREPPGRRAAMSGGGTVRVKSAAFDAQRRSGR